MSDVKPLLGRRIIVTRAREQAHELSAPLAKLGASTIELPTIRIAPLADTRELDNAIGRVHDFDWTIFTSVNGVRYFWDRLAAIGRSSSIFEGIQVAAIGSATAAALRERGMQPDFVPDEFVAERVAEGLGDVRGQRILVPRAEIARKTLPEILTNAGAYVTEIATYRTLPGQPDATAQAALEQGVDAITFTSSSTVRNFMPLANGLMAALSSDVLVACIGPITARAAEEGGLRVTVVAQEYTIPGLVDAVVDAFGQLHSKAKRTSSRAVEDRA